MTTVHTLASGSSGNAAVLSCGETHLLIDAGISCRRIAAGLKALGLVPADLAAILITHTHADHIAGLTVLLKKTACPVLASARTCRELDCRVAGVGPRLREVEAPLLLDIDGLQTRPRDAEGENAAGRSPGAFESGDVYITPVPTSHDAPGACGWRIDTADGGVGFLTDTGYVTDQAAELLPGIALAVLEANHDMEALRSGPYPYPLKQRIAGPRGHLCNEDSAAFAVALARAGAQEIVLAHLSKDNNTPAMALNAVSTALSAAGLAPALSVAPRDDLGPAHVLVRAVVRQEA